MGTRLSMKNSSLSGSVTAFSTELLTDVDSSSVMENATIVVNRLRRTFPFALDNTCGKLLCAAPSSI